MSKTEMDYQSEKIFLGVRLAVAKALAEHKKAGRSIAIWRDNKVVKIAAKDIRIPKISAKKLDD